MRVPTIVAQMAAKQGGVIEGGRWGGTWWRDGLNGAPTITWQFGRNGTVTINCTPTKPV